VNIALFTTAQRRVCLQCNGAQFRSFNIGMIFRESNRHSKTFLFIVRKQLTNFFWLCSGANIPFLERCETESSKYAGIGATIFFTGLFAAVSCGYALYTVFDNFWIATLCGILWGLMIFNLDRYIVSSMRKDRSWWKELSLALPRIILAVIISIVIAKPLELKIFEKEIIPTLNVMEQQAYATQEGELRKRFLPFQDSVRKEIILLESQVAAKTAVKDDLQRIAQEEADGTGGSRRRNLGPIFKLKKQDADKAEAELRDLMVSNQSRVAQLQKSIARNDSAMQSEMKLLVKTKLNGPAARLQALDRISAESPSIALANLFILLLFIAIETAPVFVKLISPKGPYDHLLKTEEHFYEPEGIEVKARTNAETKQRMDAAPAFEKNYVTDRLDKTLNNS
jgi:hypothetical protein